MDDLYRDYILEHYRRPHNFGAIEDADGVPRGRQPAVRRPDHAPAAASRDGKVDGVGFTGRGCAISQASASLLTDEIKGKPLSQVATLAPQDVLDLLGIDISPARLKCAMLSLDTLQQTLSDLEAPGWCARRGIRAPASLGVMGRCRCRRPA